MRTALIKDGAVTGVIVIGDEYTAPDGVTAVASDTANIGDTYDGKAFSPPTPPAPTQDQLLAYASRKQNEMLAQVWSFNVAAQGQPAHTVTTKLDSDGQFAMTKVALWAQMNTSTADAALPYSNVDFTSTTLTPAECLSLAQQTGNVDAESYATLNTVAAAIKGGTVKTFAAIDAAAWPANG